MPDLPPRAIELVIKYLHEAHGYGFNLPDEFDLSYKAQLLELAAAVGTEDFVIYQKVLYPTTVILNTLLACCQVNSSWFEKATDMIWAEVTALDRLVSILQEFGPNRAQLYASKIKFANTWAALPEPLLSSNIRFDNCEVASVATDSGVIKSPVLLNPCLKSLTVAASQWTLPLVEAIETNCPNLTELVFAQDEGNKLVQVHLPRLKQFIDNREMTIVELPYQYYDFPGMLDAVFSRPLDRISLYEYIINWVRCNHDIRSFKTTKSLMVESLYSTKVEQTFFDRWNEFENLTSLEMHFFEPPPNLLEKIGKCTKNLTTLFLKLSMIPEDFVADFSPIARSSPGLPYLLLEGIRNYSDEKQHMNLIKGIYESPQPLKNLQFLSVVDHIDIPFEVFKQIGLVCRELKLLSPTNTIPTLVVDTAKEILTEQVIFPKLRYTYYLVSKETDNHACLKDFYHKHLPSVDKRFVDTQCLLGYCAAHRPREILRKELVDGRVIPIYAPDRRSN